MEQVIIVKKNGERQAYSEEKIIRSMKRVGVPEALHQEVLAHIREKLHPEISSAEIFSHIVEYLEKADKKSSVRFNLKRALFDLGPTGFPFEKYMEKVYQSMGYKTQIDSILEGECVKHEIDILLEKDGKRIVIEAKFHNVQGNKTDVQVLLYTYARFLDIKEKNRIDGVRVVTNTKLSEDAIAYANCKGISVIAWNYPENGNLQDFVEQPNLYPITILDPLTPEERRQLLENNIVLTCDLLDYENEKLSREFNIIPEHLMRAKQAAEMICQNGI